MESSEGRLSDASVLGLLGVALFAAGLALLVFAISQAMHVLPPTYGRVTNILLSLAVGFALLITGFIYSLVSRSGEEPEVGPEGLSVTRDPMTGAREWIKLESIVKATLRPWAMSPWIRRRKYYELELEVKEGDMTIDDRFYIHVGDDGAPFLKRLAVALGERLTLPAPS